MKVLLGMSGGVDSTYAAYKLKSAGYDVEGAVLVMHDCTETEAAVTAAESLNLPIHVIDCRREFESIVVRNFIDEYRRGRTPNPCTVCNSEVKFKYLLEYALKNGFDSIATGHYADIRKNGERYAVCRAEDTKKDQTYMLWRLGQDILSHLVFPLSNDVKKDVRDSMQSKGLHGADRRDSQEICFIPDGNYSKYIEERTEPSLKGNFVDKDGNILGVHKGIINYTVGQRKGLGIALGKRVFVTAIDPEQNTVTLSDEDAERTELAVSGMVFSGIDEPEAGKKLALSVKIRYQAPLTECTLEYLGEGRGRVLLSVPQRAVTPGQCAVFYDGDMLVLGGYID